MTAYEPIDPDFKARWLDALRSGEFSQGQARLKSGDRYCCLGVGAQICGELTDSGNVIPTEANGLTSSAHYWPGMNGELRQHINGKGITGVLANMNDDGRSFAEIADWIEKNL